MELSYQHSDVLFTAKLISGDIKRTASFDGKPIVLPVLKMPGTTLDILSKELPLLATVEADFVKESLSKLAQDKPVTKQLKKQDTSKPTKATKTSKDVPADEEHSESVANLALEEGESITGEVIYIGKTPNYQRKNTETGKVPKHMAMILVLPDGKKRRIWGTQLLEAFNAGGCKRLDTVKVTLLERGHRSANVYQVELIKKAA